MIEQIRREFFNGMEPGTPLGTEGELAEQFNVSRITVRDAVRSLEAMGIVEVRVGARGGVRIAQSDLTVFSDALAVQAHLLGVEWSEITEAMRLIEPQAARLAAERAEESDIARLEELVEAQRAAKHDPETFRVFAADFHSAIAESTGNRPLYVALKALRTSEERLLIPSAVPRIADEVIASHAELCEAIRAADADEAERLMTEHLRADAEDQPR
ncbi:FadR/GntR family transcriptional regulator [Leucobacter sp. wl10]|uniref:FadR/GntR family transcriptional regulator n=1 Tax=Leucobacter sp. wl10 TaxID=2304677 RepID=UPI000E5B7FC3|nr:FCD domain-containing protein [Leucobacter sp. wl10]RGE19270.1 FadR family transcriptional regulator [Leucobacter sp. wl10]